MNTRVLMRWLMTMVIAVGVLAVIGLALNPPTQAQAAANIHDWPGFLPPCNASLQQCLDAAVVQPGDVIRIRPGVYTQSATLDKAVSLIGDGSDLTVLYAEPGQRVLTVTGNLTSSTVISGLTFAGAHLTSDACFDGCGGGLLLDSAARPTLQNLVLRENQAWQGGGMWVDGVAPLKLTNVSFISNTTVQNGGGLFALSDVRLLSSYFERNTSGNNGGGLHLEGFTSTLTANNTDFVSNAASSGGGASVNGAVVLNGGRFISNHAYTGGGLFAGTLSMTGTDFIDNEAMGSYGGGAQVNGQAQLVGGRFQQNRSLGFGLGGGLHAMGMDARGTLFISNTAASVSAAGIGGGAYLSSNPSTLEKVIFSGNTSTGDGGGLYAGGLSVTLNDVSFISNTATSGSGGGLSAQNAQVQRGVFDRNASSGTGGGVLAWSSLSLIGVRLTNNVAGSNGGGVYAGGTLGITNTLFIHNSAPAGGGVYHFGTSTGRVVNSLFARNLAVSSGASALQLTSVGQVDVIHTTIADPASVPFNPVVAIRLEAGILDVTNTIIADHALGIYNIGGSASEDYNLFSNLNTLVSGSVITGGHELVAPPQFVDAFNDDYHLRFTSPAINAGTNSGVDFDIDGQPRPIGPGFDIGFDETGSSIQELIDNTPPGGTVFIPGGVYTESLNLYKPVNLMGASTGTIIRAVTGDRVLTVTGNITSVTQIADLTLTGGDVRGGGFDRAGGGVLITDTAHPSFYNVQIVGNSADFGGGLYIHSGGASLNNSLVANNQATQSGGGAYIVEPQAVLEQNGGTIQNNLAFDGAGVFVQSGQLRQSNGAILNNTAANWGGGLLIGSGGSIRTVAGQIVGNRAQNAGGGLYVDVGEAELRDSLIVSNTAYNGGGLYVRGDFSSTNAAIIGGKLDNNSADGGGGYGGAVFARGTVFITGTRIFNNTAYDGSALEFADKADGRLVNAFVAGNVATGMFPSTNSSVRFDSLGSMNILHTTFGNATQPLTRALAVNSGVVTVANTIVASYTNGLSWFGGQLSEDYNLFFSISITASGAISHGGHSLFGRDPLFHDVLGGDYHIRGLSPAVNRGTNVGVRRDIDQDARPLGGGFDIGADEASVAGTIAGTNVGGSFTYTTMQNSIINLNVPAGAVSQTASLYCSLIDTTTLQPPRRLKFAGVVFELDANVDPVNVLPGSINFSKPVTLSVSYTDEELASAGITDERQLKLYRYETLLNDWKPIGYRPGETQTLDVDNNLITATVLGFSKFGKMGLQGGSEIYLPLILR